MPRCKLVTSYGAVLALIAWHGHLTVQEMAHGLGLTERLIHSIIAELEADGYLSKHRVGRVNRYHIHLDLPIGQLGFDAITIGDILRVVKVGTWEQTKALAQPSQNAGPEPE